MEPVWYYAVNGATTGPIALAELKAALAAGKLSPSDLVWKEGMADWVPARAVPDLAPVAPPPPPARPVPPRPPHPVSDASYGVQPAPPRPATALPLDPEPLPLDDEPKKKPKRKYRDEDDAPARVGPGAGAELLAKAQMFAKRAFAPDPSAVTPTADEEADLNRNRITDPVARRLAVWRRGVLFTAAVPSAFAALFGLITTARMETEGFSGFGVLVFYVQALALFALPAFAVLAALNYDKLATSVWFVRLGTLVTVGFPLAVAFVPSDWLIESDAPGARAAMGATFGILFYILLVPSVLSLLPAVSRACVRLKLLLPESLVPGWGLLASAPLCVLLTLATFVLLYHLFGNALLIAGLLLWVGAPLYYFTKPHLLTKPVTTAEDKAALGRASFTVFLLAVSGMVLMVLFLFTAKAFGRTLLGFDSEKCLLRPWSLDLHKVWIEYVGRSLFLTVFFADVVLRVALSVWKESKAFAGTEPAAAHDTTMAGLSESVGAK